MKSEFSVDVGKNRLLRKVTMVFTFIAGLTVAPFFPASLMIFPPSRNLLAPASGIFMPNRQCGNPPARRSGFFLFAWLSAAALVFGASSLMVGRVISLSGKGKEIP